MTYNYINPLGTYTNLFSFMTYVGHCRHVSSVFVFLGEIALYYDKYSKNESHAKCIFYDRTKPTVDHIQWRCIKRYVCFRVFFFYGNNNTRLKIEINRTLVV